MTYIDPLPIDCEFCGARKPYPLADILAYRVRCLACGQPMAASADGIHRFRKAEALELWRSYFVLESIRFLGLDLDDFSEDELEALKTIGEFADLIEARCALPMEEKLPTLPVLQLAFEHLDPAHLRSLPLSEIGKAILGKHSQDLA